jgi:NifU-like protein involved in Fe-S cluster formation
MTSDGERRGGTALYTPDLLALAVSLAQWPIAADAMFTGEARSVTCGSRVTFASSLDGRGRIDHPGIRVTACAIGQAAAALFIASAAGRSRQDIEAARAGIVAWLAGEGAMPDWPGFAILEPARAYPGRHGAIPLAWNAALAALPKETARR